MKAQLITAPGDGVAPAILLSLPGGGGSGGGALGPPPAQYLFNVPEGFSRLVLEHKLRPGPCRGCMLCPGYPGHFRCASVPLERRLSP